MGTTYNQVPRGGRLDQLQGEAVIRTLEHVERLPVAQIAQDVHGEVVAPVAHDAGRRPALRISRAVEGADLVAEGAHVLQDVALDAAHGAVGEGLGEHAALAGVDGLVARVVGVGDGVGEGVVELGLADVGLEAVDVLEGGGRVEGQAVGAEAHDGAVALVHAPELEVAVAAPGVVQLVRVGELGDERARVAGQRVEEDAVDGEAEGLWDMEVSLSAVMMVVGVGLGGRT